MKKVMFFFWLIALQSQAQTFTIDTISPQVFHRMQGKSYGANCTVPTSELRYLRISHYDAKGRTHVGELVCNRLIAKDLITIFKALYKEKYPIERMQLIDDFNADDELSMRANNTSCFNFRKVAGSSRLSAHSRGMAIDINPLYNPCVRKRRDGTVTVQPTTGRPYADRSRQNPYTLLKDDPCYRLFTAHGFRWGGSWRSVKDFQHFEM